MRLVLFWLSLWAFFACSSCSQYLSTDAYNEWVCDTTNGLHQVCNKSPLYIDIQYLPNTFRALESNPSMASQEELDKYLGTMDKFQYYTLRLQIINSRVADVTNYGTLNHKDIHDRMTYLSKQMQDNFMLIEEGDTLFCKAYQFNRSYDADQKYRDVTIAFEQREGFGFCSKELIFRPVAFGAGVVRFKFLAKQLKQIPYIGW